MTPLPKRRLSTRRQAARGRALSLRIKSGIKCTNCQNLVLPHHVCSHCGFYNGKEVLKIKVKTKKQKE